MIKEANGVMAITGAGISTSAGIPDHRSPANTVLESGPGSNESQENIELAKCSGMPYHERIDFDKISKLIQEATPTYTHMALQKLIEEKTMTCIVSTNYDNLHIKSGVPQDKIIEIHGNVNAEKCLKCGVKYNRACPVLGNVRTHLTGKMCDNTNCRGDLVDQHIENVAASR